MTKGRQGVVVADGRYLWRAGSLPGKVLDLTGAGDSFASGFLAGLIRSKNRIDYAIQLGSANATAIIKKWGAKEGLLKKNQPFPKIKVSKEKCSSSNICRVKF
jgi:sugar/nucleoside kinase (ribokinase family)